MPRYIPKLVRYLLDLLDFPKSYSGQAGKAVVVKSTEDGVEFNSPTPKTHKTSHQLGGSDELDIAPLSIPWDDTGLVLHLPFSENQGEIAKDASHYGNHGAFKGPGEPAWAEGRRGPAVSFDGTDDYINCGHDASLNVGSFTIEAWVYIRHRLAEGNVRIIDKSEINTNALRLDHGRLYIRVPYSTTPAYARTEGLISEGEWVHIVGTHDNSTRIVRLYVNGEEPSYDVYQDGIGNQDKYPNNDFLLGGGLENPFDGMIDEPRQYNRVLSVDEIKMHYLRSQTAGVPEYISRARAYRSGINQVIPTVEETKVRLNAETYDEQGEYDPTANYRFTAKKADSYFIYAQVLWVDVHTETVYRLGIYKNGVRVTYDMFTTYTTNNITQKTAGRVDLAVGDYIELWVEPDSENAAIYAGSEYSFMTIDKL